MTPDNAEELKTYLMLLGSKIEKIVLASKPLRATYQQFRLPVYLKVPGCWLAASFGEGKTVAMEYCAKSLLAEIPGLPVFTLGEQVLPGNELKSFFVRALLESKHDKPVSSNATTLKNRLSRYWADLSATSPLGCVVLLLDEGQAMRDTDELLLKDLVNEISHLHGSLLIFTFGESPKFEELVDRRKMSMTRNGAVDRLYGGQQLKLYRYETEEDWASLFREMDSQKFFELGGRSISEAYFGHMNITGFKMENEAPRFLRALKMVSSKRKASGFNLRRVFVGVRHALLMTALVSVDEKLSCICEISDNQWISSMRYAIHFEGNG